MSNKVKVRALVGFSDKGVSMSKNQEDFMDKDRAEVLKKGRWLTIVEEGDSTKTTSEKPRQVSSFSARRASRSQKS